MKDRECRFSPPLISAAHVFHRYPTGGDVRRWRVDEVISHLIKPDLDVP